MRSGKQGDPPWLPLADRLYGAALFVFPNSFRKEYGEWMRQAFRDRCREIHRGERSALRVFAFELVPDLLVTFGREQMQAGLGDVFPRQVILLGLLCLALLGLMFKDEITPPVLNQVVTFRNWVNDYQVQRQIDADEAIVAGTAQQLAARSDPGSKALAAWALSTIAMRKDSPYQSSDNQNEAFYHRPAEDASAENTQIEKLYRAVLAAKPDAFALARVAEGCRAEAGCDDREAISRLTRLVPDNGYAWELANASARERGDKLAMRHALGEMTRARYYDAYEGRTVAELLAAAKAVEPDAAARASVVLEKARVMGAIGFYYGDSITMYCARQLRDAANADTQLRLDCLAAFEVMSKGSRLETSLQGYRGIASLSADAQQRKQVRPRIRELFWLSGFTFGPAFDSVVFPSDLSEQDHAAWSKAFEGGGGELASTQRWFVARGLSASAPASYQVPPDRYAFTFVQAD